MKILIFCDHFAHGGAARVCSILSQGLVGLGYNLCIVSNFKDYKINYKLPSNAKLIHYCGDSNSKFIGSRIKTLYRRIKDKKIIIKKENPDLLISFMFMEFFETYFSNINLKKPIIVSDHTAMDRNLGVFVNFIRHRLYGLADKVTILTQKDAQFLGRRLSNKVVVYNPLTFNICNNNCQRSKIVTCVGRINQWEVKGFDLMIKIWADVYSKHNDWSLQIVGPYSSESLSRLRSMAEENGVLESISFTGQIDDMESLYRKTSIFALPSRVEGFPMVLLEAMSQGCACVSFSMKGAIQEIIRDDEDGYIVEDGQLGKFSDRLNDLINDKKKRETISLSARNNVARFSASRFINQWNDIIKTCLR